MACNRIVLNPVQSPCYQCPKRTLYCKTDCSEWAPFRNKADKYLEHRRQVLSAEAFIAEAKRVVRAKNMAAHAHGYK